jgi:predicted DNA-binding transcriptional regulator YafY
MRRGDRLIRQWRLLHILAARGGRTVQDLMEETRCSRRTVWSDLKSLQAVGFPITSEQDGREKRHRLIEEPRGIPTAPFTLTELMGLHLGRHLLVPLRGAAVGVAIHTALEKIAASLSPAARTFLAHLDRSISGRTVQAQGSSRGMETLRLLQQALQERRTLEAEYHSFGRDAVSRRRLDPLYLWYQQGGIYLAAYCHTRRQVLTFALERFHHVRITEDGFAPPPDFNLHRYLEGSFGLFRGDPVRIRLRFSRAVARYIAERNWHPSQALSLLLTGELEMALKVPLSPELRRWVLGYGKDVEVLEPKSLREDIRREWLAALRGAQGRVEPLRLAARKPRRVRAAGKTRAGSERVRSREHPVATRSQRKSGSGTGEA